MSKFQNAEHADTKMEGPSEDSGEETSEDMFFFTPSTDIPPPKIKRRPNLKGVSLAEMSLLLILPFITYFWTRILCFWHSSPTLLRLEQNLQSLHPNCWISKVDLLLIFDSLACQTERHRSHWLPFPFFFSLLLYSYASDQWGAHRCHKPRCSLHDHEFPLCLTSKWFTYEERMFAWFYLRFHNLFSPVCLQARNRNHSIMSTTAEPPEKASILRRTKEGDQEFLPRWYSRVWYCTFLSRVEAWCKNAIKPLCVSFQPWYSGLWWRLCRHG